LDNITFPFSGFKNPKIKPVASNALYIGKSVLAEIRLSTVMSVNGLLHVVLLEGWVVFRAARERRCMVERIQTSEIVREYNIT